MTGKQRIILFAGRVASAVGALAFLGVGFFAGCNSGNLPVFKSDQVESSHAGYRRTTLICGSEVYVNDYEEAALQLIFPDPSQVIGRSAFGSAKICAIPGQPTTAYIACDVGSEMPAYAVFRNTNHPPFEWRTATFREMNFTALDASRTFKQTTNSALLAEVVRTLREGTPVELPGFPFAGVTNLSTIKMFSDQLPGIVFCPSVFVDASGQIYLAEGLMMDLTPGKAQFFAKWIPVSGMFTEWMKVP